MNISASSRVFLFVCLFVFGRGQGVPLEDFVPEKIMKGAFIQQYVCLVFLLHTLTVKLAEGTMYIH